MALGPERSQRPKLLNQANGSGKTCLANWTQTQSASLRTEELSFVVCEVGFDAFWDSEVRLILGHKTGKSSAECCRDNLSKPRELRLSFAAPNESIRSRLHQVRNDSAT